MVFNSFYLHYLQHNYYDCTISSRNKRNKRIFSQLKHYIKKESPNTYEDIERVIKEIITTKIKREHLTNYLKHSFKIYKNK